MSVPVATPRVDLSFGIPILAIAIRSHGNKCTDAADNSTGYGAAGTSRGDRSDGGACTCTSYCFFGGRARSEHAGSDKYSTQRQRFHRFSPAFR